MLGLWHLGGVGRTWGEVLLGLHLERISGDSASWQAAAMYGGHVGSEVYRSGDHRVGVGLRLERTAGSSVDYTALGVGLVYRQ